MGKKEIVTVLGLFKPWVIDEYNLYELTFLMNYIRWFSSSNEKMQKEDFPYNMVGGWVSRVKAVEWAMKPDKLSRTINGLTKSNTLTVIHLASHKKKSKKTLNCNGWGGSRTFIVLNPEIINKMICWESFDEDTINKYKYFIENICGRNEKYECASIEEGTKNFNKLAKDVLNNKKRIGNIIEVSKVENEIRNKMNTKSQLLRKNVAVITKAETITTSSSVIKQIKTKQIIKPKNNDDEFTDDELEEMEADSNYMQYVPYDPDADVPEEYCDE
jgi:hypothetical protein